MSQSTDDNSNIVSSIYQEIQRSNVAAVVGFLDPNVVLHEASSLPFGGVYRGVDDVTQGISKVMEILDLTNVEVGEVIAGSDWVVALLKIPIRSSESTEGRWVSVAECWRLRNGRVVEIQPFYWDTHELGRHAGT